MNETATLTTSADALALFGAHDQYLRLVREGLGLKVVARNDRRRGSAHSAFFQAVHQQVLTDQQRQQLQQRQGRRR